MVDDSWVKVSRVDPLLKHLFMLRLSYIAVAYYRYDSGNDESHCDDKWAHFVHVHGRRNRGLREKYMNLLVLHMNENVALFKYKSVCVSACCECLVVLVIVANNVTFYIYVYKWTTANFV